MYRVLVADDEDVLRRNLMLILNSSGYQAQAVRTVNEAINSLKHRKFDLLITDLVIPEQGGGELIQHVTRSYPQTAIIIITAYPSAESAISAVKRGVMDYFTKPFKTEELLTAVKRAVERKKESPLGWESLKPYKITKREAEVLKLIVDEGISDTNAIAERLGIKATTVKDHLDNLFGKFQVHSRPTLIATVMKAMRS